MPHTPNKRHRPTKRCPVCQRPFQWRKKWAQNWAEVRYCSKRCRQQAKQETAQ